MPLAHVSDVELKALFGKGKPVVVDFYADWCGPCRVVGPELETLAARSEGKVEFVKLDVDAHPRFTAELGIMGVPTVIHYGADGNEVARAVGAARADVLAQRLLLG
ncbi:MAG TPA: thioredoxin family protein [Actinomycetota bacterium]|jgi:thioredoxin 1|nr:thioredoxin family protein [Actinomycetota bacterium]